MPLRLPNSNRVATVECRVKKTIMEHRFVWVLCVALGCAIPAIPKAAELPSPDTCVEAHDVYVYTEEWKNVVIKNGCPAPVLILFMGRAFHEGGGGIRMHISPLFGTMSAQQGLTFEERLVEAMKNKNYCEEMPSLDSCNTDVLQPGQQTLRGGRFANIKYEWAMCAQYHPLSLDAASGPRECDVNPDFFLPNTLEVRIRLQCPANRSLESCFRGRR